VLRWAAFEAAQSVVTGSRLLPAAQDRLDANRAWIDTWNDDPKPYVWTKTADQILESIARYCTRINDSRH
jgi:hypothetical protein